MKTVSLDQFYKETGIVRLEGVKEHHFTGPPCARQVPGHGAVMPEEGILLASIAAHHGGPILEIGADLGVSTRFLHEGLDRRGEAACIASIDVQHLWPEDGSYPRRVRIVQDSQTCAQCPAVRALGPYQWAFIDGNHCRPWVEGDIRNAIALGARVLVFHDTTPNCPPGDPSGRMGSDARAVVQEMLGGIASEFYDITTFCGVMYVSL